MNCSACKNSMESNWLFCPFCGHKAGSAQQLLPSMRAGSYGAGVRAQILELAVRQALAGGNWRESCANIMKANNITPEEVEYEVRRRSSMGDFYAQQVGAVSF